MSGAAVIWKYEVPVTDEFTIELPNAFRVLTVQTQRGVPQLWVLVDPDAEFTVPQRFWLVGTGHPITHGGDYIGTFQIGTFVFHLFMERTMSAHGQPNDH